MKICRFHFWFVAIFKLQNFYFSNFASSIVPSMVPTIEMGILKNVSVDRKLNFY